MRKMYYAPDADGTSAGGKAEKPDTGTHVRHLANVPAKDAVLASVSLAVANAWADNAFITLAWKTQSDFATDANTFQKTFKTG